MYKIVVLQRGWVVVGKWSKDGTTCKIEDGAVIRRWGTSKGIVELEKGPTKNTILDSIPTLEYHELNEVFNLAVDGESWQKTLSQ